MQGRQVLARRVELWQRFGGRRGLIGPWVPAAALWLCVQLVIPGCGYGKLPKMEPNEVQSGYRDVLSILATGDEDRALEALFEFETAVVGDERPWKRVENFWRLKLRVLRELLDADSLALMMPVIMLHHDANQLYVERNRPFLAGHSRMMSVELAEIYADRANTSAAREFSGWVMTSLGAMLWAPTSVISSADFFFRAQMADPSNPIALMGLGAAYERNANYDKAIEYLTRLLELDSEDSVAALHLALCQLRSDVTLRDQALETLRSLQQPEEVSWVRSIAHQEAARAQLAAGEMEAAETTIRRGLKALPGDQQLSLQLAMLLDGQRRRREMLAVLRGIEPGDGRVPSSRLIYDVWEPADLEDIRARLRSDAALGLPILADKLGPRSPAGKDQ